MIRSDLAWQPSLAHRISINVATAALVMSLLQLLAVATKNYFEYDDVVLEHVKREALLLSTGLASTADGYRFTLPKNAEHYRNPKSSSYAFRIIDSSGRVIASENAAIFETISPWRRDSGDAMPGLWFNTLDNSERFHFAGGSRIRTKLGEVLIETATRGDPEKIRWRIVAQETLEDVWLPILPFILLIPLVSLFAVRQGLTFLTAASRQAESIEPRRLSSSFEMSDVPREAFAFVDAINRLLARVRALVESNTVFLASSAHELRTPLAIMLLELELITDERARVLEKDVARLTDSIDRLLTLVRLESVQDPDLVELDLTLIAQDLVKALTPWIVANNHLISLSPCNSATVKGDPAAIRAALRNLIENAVKHTAPGTAILVTAAPDGSIIVEDDGPGLMTNDTESLFRPFSRGSEITGGSGLGLTIVRRAIDLHGGAIEVGRSLMGGAKFTLRFATSRYQSEGWHDEGAR